MTFPLTLVICLLVGHRRARWPGEVDDFEAFEADFAAPLAEVRAGIIEGVAEFDEHVQRHQQALDVLAAGVVNQRFDGHQRAAGRQGVVGRADEVHLLLQIPVVQNHAHRDDVGLGQRVFEEIAGRRADAILQPGGGDVFLRDRLDRRQIEADALEMRMSLRDFDAKQAGRAADVAERLEFREIKFVRERLEVDAREAGHRAHELFQPGQVRVEFLEHALLAVLDFVLRLAGAQRLGQVVPEFEEPRVEHDQNAADVARAGFIEEQRAFGRVEILRLRAVAFAAEKLHRDERVEKIRDAARVELQFRAQLRAGEAATGRAS